MSSILIQKNFNERLIEKIIEFYNENKIYYNNFFNLLFISYEHILDFFLQTGLNDNRIYGSPSLLLYGNEYYKKTNIKYIIEFNYNFFLQICVTDEHPYETIKKLELNIKQTYYDFKTNKTYYIGDNKKEESTFLKEKDNYIFKINGKKTNIKLNNDFKDIIFNNVLQKNINNLIENFKISIDINLTLSGSEIILAPINLLVGKIIKSIFKNKKNTYEYNFKLLNNLTENEYYIDEQFIHNYSKIKEELVKFVSELYLKENYIILLNNKQLRNNAEELYSKLVSNNLIIEDINEPEY